MIMSEPTTHEDKFIAMVTAKAEVDLRLSDFQPRSMLVTPVHDLKRAKFPAIDYHNHLDAQDPATVLKVMDECGIERIVNITMQVGNEALAVIKRFHSSAPGRFATYAWMDWTDLHRVDFFNHCADRLEEMVEHGACGLKVWKDLGTSLRDSTDDLLRVDDERLAPMFEKAAELGVPVMFHTADPDAFFLPVDERNERFEELAAHPNWSFCLAHFGKQELLQQRDRVRSPHDVCCRTCRRACGGAFLCQRYAREASQRSRGYRGSLSRTRATALYGARIFSEAQRSHSVWHGPGSRRRHVSPALQISGDSGRVLRIPVACIAPGALEHLWLVPAGRRSEACLSRKRTASVAAMSPVDLIKSPDVRDRLQIPPDRLPPATKGRQRAPSQDWLRPVSTGASARSADVPIGSGCF